jgi:hypothetical protein
MCFFLKACQFRNQQSRTVVKFGDHSSIWDSWPMAFSGYPRGPKVGCETRCPFILRRLTGRLPSLAGNVVAGSEIRGSGRIVGNPFPYRIMEGLPVIQAQSRGSTPDRLLWKLLLRVAEVPRMGPRSTTPESQSESPRSLSTLITEFYS